MIYKDRISDIELQRKLNASGGVLIKGAKACGKTESAKQIAKSVLSVDRDEQVGEFLLDKNWNKFQNKKGFILNPTKQPTPNTKRQTFFQISALNMRIHQTTNTKRQTFSPLNH